MVFLRMCLISVTISIIPLLIAAPAKMPAEAIIVTTRYDADLVPTADDMKLHASLLTPAHNPMTANKMTIPSIIGNIVAISCEIFAQKYEK